MGFDLLMGFSRFLINGFLGCLILGGTTAYT
jgi:hypothetical protein